MPDMDKAIKDLEEVREYIARKGHDLASRKCMMMDKVTDALELLKEQGDEIYALRVELASANELAEGYAELLKEQDGERMESNDL